MPGHMTCPYCQATVKPRVGADGQNLCPVCNNRGTAGRAPAPPPASPTFSPLPPPMAPQRTSGRAVASLCLGIASIVVAILAIILSPLAILFGVKALRETKDGSVGGRGLAIGGIVTGSIGILIGVTVVLAAIVFVLVANLSAGGEGAPDVAFTTDDANDRITVVRVAATDPPLDWDDLDVEGGQCSKPSGRVDAGDMMQCNGPGAVTIRHVRSDIIVYDTQFND